LIHAIFLDRREITLIGADRAARTRAVGVGARRKPCARRRPALRAALAMRAFADGRPPRWVRARLGEVAGCGGGRRVGTVYEERAAGLAGAVLWRRTAEPDDRTSRVLPDGCMDLLWWGGEIVIAGPDTAAYLSKIRAGDTLVGLRLPPGTAPMVLGVPASELRDARVPLSALWPDRVVRETEERVATDPDTALERLAADRLAAAGGPDPVAERVAVGLRAGASVGAVAGALNLSARQLQRRCLAAFGYGPKMLARVLRMGRALDLARGGAGLAAAAADAGYADQAHFTREVRALAGTTPTTLLAA
jgi:AraC-like DNA-binding protein